MVERVVDVLRPVTERETMGVMRAWSWELQGVSDGTAVMLKVAHEFIVQFKNSGLICPMKE